MSRHFFFLKGSFFLFVLEGSDNNKWTFTFPENIKALKHSDVEIPCNFTAPSDHGAVHLIWFKYEHIGYPQVYNSEDPSQVIQEYRNRTSLVGNGTKSCSLRINDVRETGSYYPGINKDSYKMNNKQSVQVKVSGCYEDSSCKDWHFTFPHIIFALKGSCVEIPCTFTHPMDTKDFNFFWYMKKMRDYPQVFNNRTPTDVEHDYKGRTFLVGNTNNNCSLRINDVQKTEHFFPGINTDINSYDLNEKFTRVSVSDNPPTPLITGIEDMEEKKIFNISCAVNHTCASNPPSLKWNKDGYPITVRHKETFLGNWRMESEMRYIPSYTDDQTELECIATFPNNITSIQKVTLNIKYGPKNSSISVVGSMKTTEGDNVTLRCTSQANPPITNYRWYKVGKSRTLLPDHNETITVRNVTSDNYVCLARNEIGEGESPIFGFTNQTTNLTVYLIIGGAAGLVVITLLVVLFCICNRRKKKSSISKEKRTEENIQEQIQMEDHLYGNMSMQNLYDVPEQSVTRSQESSHGYNNNKDKSNSQTKSDESDGILYASVKLPAPSQVPKHSKKIEETEYTTLQY